MDQSTKDTIDIIVKVGGFLILVGTTFFGTYEWIGRKRKERESEEKQRRIEALEEENRRFEIERNKAETKRIESEQALIEQRKRVAELEEKSYHQMLNPNEQSDLDFIEDVAKVILTFGYFSEGIGLWRMEETVLKFELKTSQGQQRTSVAFIESQSQPRMEVGNERFPGDAAEDFVIEFGRLNFQFFDEQGATGEVFRISAEGKKLVKTNLEELREFSNRYLKETFHLTEDLLK